MQCECEQKDFSKKVSECSICSLSRCYTRYSAKCIHTSTTLFFIFRPPFIPASRRGIVPGKSSLNAPPETTARICHRARKLSGACRSYRAVTPEAQGGGRLALTAIPFTMGLAAGNRPATEYSSVLREQGAFVMQ